MLVVSDTTAITSLLKIGRAGILTQLFRKIVVPPAVHDELLKYHKEVPSFLQVNTLKDRSEVLPLLQRLDLGEAEAIVLALELRADALRAMVSGSHAGMQGLRICSIGSLPGCPPTRPRDGMS